MTEEIVVYALGDDRRGIKLNKLGPYSLVEKMPRSGRVICADLSARPRVDLLHQGARWLDHWEVICPLRPYEELAEDLTTDPAVLKIVGDLRVPAYDPRLVFMRVGRRTQSLWSKFIRNCDRHDPRIAFQVAVWETMPYIKPLPAEEWIIKQWTSGIAYTGGSRRED